MPSRIAQSGDHYQVAIVGGGIAGVTLALAFERLGINYALFEARESLESDEGAGIGLQPNGERILDQLGLLEEIEQHTLPLQTWYSFDAHGKLLSSSTAMGHYRSRIGYGVMFLERRKLLQIMSSRLEGRGLIKTSSRVTSIQEEEDHVIVTTDDGYSVTADLVIGADGVRSCVRGFIDSSHPDKTIHSADDYMSVGYATAYGMSSPTAGIVPGERFAVYREKETVIGFTGKDGIVFWFVFEHLGQSYPLSKRPRYTMADAEALCESVADLQVTPSLRFGELYANRTVAIKIAVEEGAAKTWHTDRAVIVGDAAHKMTPAGGQGANQAIESSAVLVNEIMRALKASPDGKLSRDALRSALACYSDQRMRQAATALERSRMVCEALFCFSGPTAAIVKQMMSLSDEDWLFRAFMGLSDAPILEDFELSARGNLYNETIESLRRKVKEQQNGLLKQS